MSYYRHTKNRKISSSALATMRQIEDLIGNAFLVDDFGYARVPSTKLHKINAHYKNHIRTMKDSGVLLVDDWYSTDHHISKGYLLLNSVDEVFGDQEPQSFRQLLKPKRNKYRGANWGIYFFDVPAECDHLYDLKRWTKKGNREYYPFRHSIRKLISKDFSRAKRDRKSRLYSVFTSVPKELRQRLQIGGESIAEIDIKTCQPFLIGVLSGDTELLNVTTDPERDFYDLVFDTYKSRTAQKQSFGLLVHGSNDNRQRLKATGRFQELFPVAFDWITNTRKPCYPLFRAESAVMIDDVLFPLLEEKIVCATVHDAICCRPDDTPKISSLIQQSAIRRWGKAPLLTTTI